MGVKLSQALHLRTSSRNSSKPTLIRMPTDETFSLDRAQRDMKSTLSLLPCLYVSLAVPHTGIVRLSSSVRFSRWRALPTKHVSLSQAKSIVSARTRQVRLHFIYTSRGGNHDPGGNLRSGYSCVATSLLLALLPASTSPVQNTFKCNLRSHTVPSVPHVLFSLFPNRL